MPYIKPAIRNFYDLSIGELNHHITDPGELNYVITRLCLGYMRKQGKRYGTLNAIVGVLNCATFEFYRRWVIPYENEKIKENGDVT